MDVAIILVGTVAIWAFLSSRANNPHLKNLLYFQTLLLTFAMSYTALLYTSQDIAAATSMWVNVMSIATLAYLFTWAGFWIVGRIENERWDNDQDF